MPLPVGLSINLCLVDFLSPPILITAFQSPRMVTWEGGLLQLGYLNGIFQIVYRNSSSDHKFAPPFLPTCFRICWQAIIMSERAGFKHPLFIYEMARAS